MTIGKVTRNYQITVPKDFRSDIGIKVGDSILIRSDNKEIRIRKVSEDMLDKSFGSWRVKDSVKFVRKIRDESEERLKGLGL